MNVSLKSEVVPKSRRKPKPSPRNVNVSKTVDKGSGSGQSSQELNKKCGDNSSFVIKNAVKSKVESGLRTESMENMIQNTKSDDLINNQEQKLNHRTSYLAMLSNITSDLDNLLLDVDENSKTGDSSVKRKASGQGKIDVTSDKETVQSGDTLGKDSLLSSSAANTSCSVPYSPHSQHRLHTGHAVSEQSLTSIESNQVDMESVDSGHVGQHRSGVSPLLFDPNHFNGHSQPHNIHIQRTSPMPVQTSSGSSGQPRSLSVQEKLEKTDSLWLLTGLSRAGAVHLLKDMHHGNFLVRNSSQPNSLALSVQSRARGQPTVDHYLIDFSDYGLRVQGSNHVFSTLPALLAYYMENTGEIPYRLSLPAAVLYARTTRELASLNMLGQDFWTSPLSKESIMSDGAHPPRMLLHKSCSEPINIQKPGTHHIRSNSTDHFLQNTPPSKSESDVAHFLSNRRMMEQYFEKHLDIRHSPSSSEFKSSPSPQVSHKNSHKSQQSHISSNLPTNSLHNRVFDNGVQKHDSRGLKSNIDSFNYCVDSSSPVQVKTCTSVPLSCVEDPYTQRPCNVPLAHTSINSQSRHRSVTHPTSCNTTNVVNSSTAFSPHPHPVPKLRSNLYFTTNLDLLDIPENRYFRSSLSDKLSDYEDIWRNSLHESEIDRISAQHGLIRSPNFQANPYPEVNKMNSVIHSQPSNRSMDKDGRRKVLRKSSQNTWIPKTSSGKIDAVTGGKSGLTALEEARVIAGTESEEEVLLSPKIPLPVAHIKGIQRLDSVFSEDLNVNQSLDTCNIVSNRTQTFNDDLKNNGTHTTEKYFNVNSYDEGQQQIKFVTSHLVDFSPRSSTSRQSDLLDNQNSTASGEQLRVTTTMSVVVSPDSKRAPPSSDIHFPVSRPPNLHGRLSRLKSSSDSSLATVSSPLYAEPADAVRLRDKFGKPISVQVRRRSEPLTSGPARQRTTMKVVQSKPVKNIEPNPITESKQKEDSHIKHDSNLPSRTLSMRTPREMQQLDKKFNWLNRLKLGTKLLTENLTPTKINPKQSMEYEMGTKMISDDPNSFLSPGRFPVHDGACANNDNSTVQELISTIHPELCVRPIVLSYHSRQSHRGDTRPVLSEYDNLQIYKTPSVSSQDTVYSPPWETTEVNKLLSNPPRHKLPPEMGLEERVGRWQEKNSNYVLNSSKVESVKHTPQSVKKTNSKVFIPPQLQQRLAANEDATDGVFLTNRGTSHPHQGKHTVKSKNSGKPKEANRLSSQYPDVVHCHALVTPHNTLACQSRDESHTQPHLQGLINKRNGNPSLSPPGSRITEYIQSLSRDQNTIFGSTIENFVQCTLDSQEKNPQHVMRNVRQFMSGIRNYLVKHGEGELEDLIEKERNRLSVNEILNIDAIIEQALHVCVLQRVNQHIYTLFVDKYSQSGALEQLSQNIRYARSKSAQDLGVKTELKLPDPTEMEVIRHHLDEMQRAYSPLVKLQNLLKATSTIYQCVQGKTKHLPTRGHCSLGADDFLPMLIYVIVHCGLVSAEIEADYIWGLLQPSLLTGEGGYYLTTLSSAILVLKNFQDTHHVTHSPVQGELPGLSDMQGYLKIAIPDELHGSINWRTLPVRPSMTTKDVCALIAHKFKVTNPQDFGFYLIQAGLETQLSENEFPQIVKGDKQNSGCEFCFAYKRLDANIAWPKSLTVHTTAS